MNPYPLPSSASDRGFLEPLVESSLAIGYNRMSSVVPYGDRSKLGNKTTDHKGLWRPNPAVRSTFTTPEGIYTKLSSTPFPQALSLSLGGTKLCWTKACFPNIVKKEKENKEKDGGWRVKMAMGGFLSSHNKDRDDRSDINEHVPLVEAETLQDINAELEKCSLDEEPSLSSVGPVHNIPRPSRDMRLVFKGDSAVTAFDRTSRFNKYMGKLGKDGGTSAMWGVYSQKHCISWSELGTSGSQPEPLARIFFISSPCCHAIIQSTATNDRLDIIVGLSSGIIVWIDPILGTCQEYRIDGLYKEHPVLSLHCDPSCPMRLDLSLPEPARDSNIVDRPWEDLFNARKKEEDDECPADMIEGRKHKRAELGLVQWVNEEWVVEGKGKRRGERTAYNPVSVMSAGSRDLEAIEYSPDGKYLALSGTHINRFTQSRKALLSIISMPDVTTYRTFGPGHDLPDYHYVNPQSFAHRHNLHHAFCFTSLAWSADSRLIAAGGDRNGLTIFSPSKDRARAARCEGLANDDFMSTQCVAFDNETSKDGKYRLGCVLPEYCRFMLWDFDPSLTRYKPEKVIEIKARDLPGPSKWSFNNYVLLEYSGCHLVGAAAPTDIYFMPDSIAVLEGLGKLHLWKRPEWEAEGGIVVEP
ncbi:hypothetical protein IAR50_003030 [Cryptococcus sp. DSM 104548]